MRGVEGRKGGERKGGERKGRKGRREKKRARKGRRGVLGLGRYFVLVLVLLKKIRG